MTNSLISIIIPTRNRQLYAVKTVNQIIGLNQDIQIIVQDNSDDDSLRGMLGESIANGKVEYYYENKPLPFSDNYNRAAEQATGRYLCAIGDDDAILPCIIKCAEWMESEKIDAVKPIKNINFYYSGVIKNENRACIGINQFTGHYRFSNPEVGVIDLLNDGGSNYPQKDLIGSYHCLVNMDLMNKVKSSTGVYYGGLTPDMYSVICLSMMNPERFAIVDYPITIPGVCPSSGSAANISNKHVGTLDKSPHLKLLPNYEWSSIVPKYYSVETIWAETMIHSLMKLGRMDLVDRYFNKYALALSMYTNNTCNRSEILSILPEELKTYVIANSSTNTNKREKYYDLFNKIAIKTSGHNKVYYTNDDISVATKLAVDYLKNSSIKAPWEKGGATNELR